MSARASSALDHLHDHLPSAEEGIAEKFASAQRDGRRIFVGHGDGWISGKQSQEQRSGRGQDLTTLALA